MIDSIDVQKFRDYEARKLISCKEHPSADLLIWNYTQRVQFEKLWDDVTLISRGLITDRDGTIVARPFRKFFNLGEHDERIKISTVGAIASEKYDGSLGILYHDGNSYCLATRGSFQSDQAIRGTQLLQSHIEQFGDGWIVDGITYLFEIVYPENRIVVDYGPEERLVLLAGFEAASGREIDIDGVDYHDKTKIYRDFGEISSLYALEQPNSEGLVIKFPNDLRLKVKWDEYVRLHRIVTGVNSKTIWEALSNGDSLDEILDRVPDEFYDWVTNVKKDLEAAFQTQLSEGIALFERVVQLQDRKTQAIFMKDSPKVARSLAFAMLDGKPFQSISEIIWKSLKPVAERPFTEDAE